MLQSYVFAYSSIEQKINDTLSFETMNISNKFRKINNDSFISEEKCVVIISLRVTLITEEKKSKVILKVTKNSKDIDATVIDINQNQTITTSFTIELDKDDVLRFHINSDNESLKIAPLSFNDQENSPKCELPISASLTINSIN